jgi:hypothetical protein
MVKSWFKGRKEEVTERKEDEQRKILLSGCDPISFSRLAELRAYYIMEYEGRKKEIEF